MAIMSDITLGTVKGNVVPALDPRTPYSSRLSARSALYTDLQLPASPSNSDLENQPRNFNKSALESMPLLKPSYISTYK